MATATQLIAQTSHICRSHLGISLENDQRFSGKRLPSRPRIAAFLSQEGFTRKYERHTELPQARAEDPQHPHEKWEMDAQGVIKVAELGSVSIINISDLFSRLKVDSFPCLNTSHPSTPDYQLVLRRALCAMACPSGSASITTVSSTTTLALHPIRPSFTNRHRMPRPVAGDECGSSSGSAASQRC